MVRVMVIFLYNNGAQPLPCHMALHAFYAAGGSAVIEDAAYLDSPVSLFGIIVSPLHFSVKFLIFPLSV